MGIGPVDPLREGGDHLRHLLRVVLRKGVPQLRVHLAQVHVEEEAEGGTGTIHCLLSYQEIWRFCLGY